jgi:DNA-binding NarL/FixJ family response regulator
MEVHAAPAGMADYTTICNGRKFMENKPISILAVDDHPIFLDGIRNALSIIKNVKLVATASTGTAAIETHRRLRPDITLMDLRLPDITGGDAIIKIRQQAPAAKIVVLTTYEEEAYATQAMRAGAMGYLLKSAIRHELQETIELVHSGRRRILPSVACAIAEQMYAEKLTLREIDVIRLVAFGNTNRKIGDQLGLTESTVKSHIKNLMLKLQARDRTHAVLLCMQRGIITTTPSGFMALRSGL